MVRRTLRGIARNKTAIWSFTVAVAYWPGIMSAAWVPRWGAIAIGAPLVSKLDVRELDPLARGLLLGGLVAAVASLLLAPSLPSGMHDLIFLAVLCTAFVAGAGMASPDTAMAGAAAGLMVSSLLAIPQFFAGWSPVWQAGNPGPAGLFFNSELFAEFAAIVLVWALIAQRWLYAVVAVVPVAICQSRIAILAVAVGLLYACTSRKLFLVGLTLILLAGAASVLFLGHTAMFSGVQRIVIWNATIMAFTPLGNGIGWFHFAHPPEEFAHSDVLQFMAELGVGSLFFLAIPFVALSRNRGTNAQRAAFLAFCVEAVVSFPFHAPATGFLGSLLAGYLSGGWRALPLGERVCGTVGAGGPGGRSRFALSLRPAFAYDTRNGSSKGASAC